MLELDTRISDKDKIFNRLNADDAQEYIGEKGYFADSLASFANIHTVYYGTLKDSGDGGFEPENRKGDVFEFFLPQKFVVSDNCREPKSVSDDIADLNERLRDIETDFPDALERIEELERSLTSLSARVELLEGILYYRKEQKSTDPTPLRGGVSGGL